MEGLHDDHEPEFAIPDCLLETGDGTLGWLHTDCVAVHSVLGELTFGGGEPFGTHGVIGKEESSKAGNDECENT